MVAGLLVSSGLAIWLGGLVGGGAQHPLLGPRRDISGRDQLAFTAAQANRLERSAAFGFGHVLYAKSPGGALAAAERTARFRLLIEQAARGTRIAPDLLEAIVFVESSGRPDVVAGSDPSGASGLAQILAETAKNFLSMPVDLVASRKLTREIARASRGGEEEAARRLRAKRRLVDARFDPTQALAGAVKYLSFAGRRFGRSDLAIVSYHMGIGNLEAVLRDYAQTQTGEPIATIVARAGLSWARLYFDASPIAHAAAWRRLTNFGDDSRSYYWRVLAARQIMRLYRQDRSRLVSLARLQTQKASGEEALHPADRTERFRTPSELEHAWDEHLIQPLPTRPERAHFRDRRENGRAAPRLRRRSRALSRPAPRGARPAALPRRSRPNSQQLRQPHLIVTSTVRDDRDQQQLVQTNPEATPELLAPHDRLLLRTPPSATAHTPKPPPSNSSSNVSKLVL